MKFRRTLTLALLLVPVLFHAAAASDDERGWSFSQRFQGSSNAAGIVMKTNSTLAYDMNKNVRMYLGLPVYFARQSGSAPGEPFMNGVGNAFAGMLLSVNQRAFAYSSDLLATAPTGDRSRGFSTGHATVDWTNTFSRSFSAITPYASVGAANTISDTAFFVRPFTSKGAVVHYEAGALIDVTKHWGIGGSAYGVRAAGEQEIVSKVVENPSTLQSGSSTPASTGVLSSITQRVGLAKGNGNGNAKPAVFETQYETTSTAEIANDHGFSTWLSVRPTGNTDLQIGFSRSVTYQLNSVFFGLGFRVGH